MSTNLVFLFFYFEGFPKGLIQELLEDNLLVLDVQGILQDDQPLMEMCKLEWQYLGNKYTVCWPGFEPGPLIAGECAYHLHYQQ